MMADRRPRFGLAARKPAKSWANTLTQGTPTRKDLDLKRWYRLEAQQLGRQQSTVDGDKAEDMKAEPEQGGEGDVSMGGTSGDVQTTTVTNAPPPLPIFDRFDKYNVQVDVPTFDDEIYEKHLTNPDWTREETEYLIETYRDCNGKWPVVWDRYEFGAEAQMEEGEGGAVKETRSVEHLKARYYQICAQLLQLRTPIASMGASDYQLYDTLIKFKPETEASRKKLAEGHLYRKSNEVDEESVLLNELQRIMINQATLDTQREDLRRRLDYPAATTNANQYTTSQQLTSLWQQLLAQDRMKKNPRLRPTGNPTIDGFAQPGSANHPSQSGPRNSIAGLSEVGSLAGGGNRRQTRDSLPSVTPGGSTNAAQHSSPLDLSKADMIRFGVFQPDANSSQKLPSGITFASDKLSKPRIAKSTLQTDKIAAILNHIGVPELISIPTPKVIESFEGIMSKVHALLELRKVAEKEEHELKVRKAEVGSG